MICTLKADKILLREIKDDLNMKKDKPCSWIQKLNIVYSVDFS